MFEIVVLFGSRMSAQAMTRPNGGYTKATQIVIIKHELNRHRNLEIEVNEIAEL